MYYYFILYLLNFKYYAYIHVCMYYVSCIYYIEFKNYKCFKHTYIHTYIYTYIHTYIYICVCVCEVKFISSFDLMVRV